MKPAYLAFALWRRDVAVRKLARLRSLQMQTLWVQRRTKILVGRVNRWNEIAGEIKAALS